MPHRGRLVAVVVLLVIVIATAYEVLYMDISALPEPGRVESTVATRAKDWYIRPGSRHSMSMPPQSSAAMISTGETLFGMGCANCHGQDGRKRTDATCLLTGAGQTLGERTLSAKHREKWMFESLVRTNH